MRTGPNTKTAAYIRTWIERIQQPTTHTKSHRTVLPEQVVFGQPESTDIQETTCLRGCFGHSCSCLPPPNTSILSLRLDPRSQQPLRDNAPTLPASPAPIKARTSQLAARARSEPADWRHETEDREGEGRKRTGGGRRRRRRARPVFLLSCLSGWRKMICRKGLRGPQAKA